MGGNQHEFVILVLIFLIVSLLSSVDVIRGRSAQINFYKVTRQTALQKEEPKKEAVEALEPPPAQPLFYRQQDSGSKPHGFYGSPPPSPPPPPPHKTPPPSPGFPDNYNTNYYVTHLPNTDVQPEVIEAEQNAQTTKYDTDQLDDEDDDIEDEDFEELDELENSNHYTTKGKKSKTRTFGPASRWINANTQTKPNYAPTQTTQQGMSDTRFMYSFNPKTNEFNTKHPYNQQNYNSFTKPTSYYPTTTTTTPENFDPLADQEEEP